MSSLQSWLGEAKDMRRKKMYMSTESEKPGMKYTAEPRKKKIMSTMSNGYYLLSDFGYKPIERFAGTAKADKIIQSLSKADKKLMNKASELRVLGQENLNRAENYRNGTKWAIIPRKLRPLKNPDINRMDRFTPTKFDNISPALLDRTKTREILPLPPSKALTFEERSPVYMQRYVEQYGAGQKRQGEAYKARANKANEAGRKLAKEDLKVSLLKKPYDPQNVDKALKQAAQRRSLFDRSLYARYGVSADFGVPMWQRALIEAREGAKTIGGVVKDVVTKQAYTDPRKAAMWQGDLGRGFAEARNRVQQSLRKANDANIERELIRNKKTMAEQAARQARKETLREQIKRTQQETTKKWREGRLGELAPTPRADQDGVLALDKRYKVGKNDRSVLPIIPEPVPTRPTKRPLKSAGGSR